MQSMWYPVQASCVVSASPRLCLCNIPCICKESTKCTCKDKFTRWPVLLGWFSHRCVCAFLVSCCYALFTLCLLSARFFVIEFTPTYIHQTLRKTVHSTISSRICQICHSLLRCRKNRLHSPLGSCYGPINVSR